jgi:outer membrane lipoprotein SlyB
MMSAGMRTIGMALTMVGFLVASEASAQSAPPTRVRGSIASINGQDLVVKSRDGANVPIKLAPDYAVTAVVKADMSDITVGKFVGIAALPQGSEPERALEVLIFPEAARGSGEGHYAWDLMPESTMTNATIAESVDKIDGRTLTLKHKDGETRITVPKDVPIVTFAPGDRNLLLADAGIMVPAVKQPDGTFTASRVLVGKDGVKPPM